MHGLNGKKMESQNYDFLKLWLIFKYIPGSMGPFYLFCCLKLEMLVTSFPIGFNNSRGPPSFRGDKGELTLLFSYKAGIYQPPNSHNSTISF